MHIVDQWRSERVGDEVSIPGGDLRGVVQEPQQRAVHVAPTLAGGASVQTVRCDEDGAQGGAFTAWNTEEVPAVGGCLSDIISRPAGQAAGYDVGPKVVEIPEVITTPELDGVRAMHPGRVLRDEVVFAGPKARTSVLGVKVDGVAPHFAAGTDVSDAGFTRQIQSTGSARQLREEGRAVPTPPVAHVRTVSLGSEAGTDLAGKHEGNEAGLDWGAAQQLISTIGAIGRGAGNVELVRGGQSVFVEVIGAEQTPLRIDNVIDTGKSKILDHRPGKRRSE